MVFLRYSLRSRMRSANTYRRWLRSTNWRPRFWKDNFVCSQSTKAHRSSSKKSFPKRHVACPSEILMTWISSRCRGHWKYLSGPTTTTSGTPELRGTRQRSYWTPSTFDIQITDSLSEDSAKSALLYRTRRNSVRCSLVLRYEGSFLQKLKRERRSKYRGATAIGHRPFSIRRRTWLSP